MDATEDDGSCQFDDSSDCPILDFSFTNTGDNMTVLFNDSFVNSQDIEIGTQIGAFFLDQQGVPFCAGASSWTGEMVSIAVMGDDSSTPEIDGFQQGDTIYMVYQYEGEDVMGLDLVDAEIIYESNGLFVPENGSFVNLCQDELYCELPNAFVGNTGSNMTVMLLSDFITSLNVTDENAYLVALTESGLVVGSEAIYGVSQTTLAIWGDDSQTPEVDGASANESISFQLVNGTDLYNVVMPSALTFVGNGLVVQNSAAQLNLVVCESSTILGCMDATADNYNMDATEDDGSCTYIVFGCMDVSAVNYNMDATEDDGSCTYTVFGCMDASAVNYNMEATQDDGSCQFNETGDCDLPSSSALNTGSNMTVMLTTSFLNSLNISDEDAYLVALTETGLVVGVRAVFGVSQVAIAIYGDDATTNEIDGASSNETLSFQLVNGTDLYNVAMPLEVNYVGNGLVIQTDSGVLSLVECGTSPVLGCMDATADNYNMDATEDDGSCTYIVLGCTDATADNYTMDATEDDGSCTYTVLGCMDATADNYNMDATEDDASCTYTVFGCTNELYFEYNPEANQDNGSCITLIVSGCLDIFAFNYNPNANFDDGSCEAAVYGCTDDNYIQFDASANVNNGSCITLITSGCTDLFAFNYNANANLDDGSCVSSVFGCTNEVAFNFNQQANTDDGSCIAFVYGCTDNAAFNYNPNANTDNGTCISQVEGCTNPIAYNYNSAANVNDGSCIAISLGCTDFNSFNYNPNANTDNGTCIDVVQGCTDEFALNYNPNANTDDASCTQKIFGCTEQSAFNYNPNANTDNGSCIAEVEGCTNPAAFNYSSA
ncbi:hypothetical protein N9I98_05050, partial [Flavobacteriales bacterium]|nr:hypothetical protein [Flavobacteriales bacterium]